MVEILKEEKIALEKELAEQVLTIEKMAEIDEEAERYRAELIAKEDASLEANKVRLCHQIAIVDKLIAKAEEKACDCCTCDKAEEESEENEIEAEEITVTAS